MDTVSRAEGATATAAPYLDYAPSELFAIQGVDNRMYHPAFCYLGVALTFILTGLIFRWTPLDSNDYFYVPIVLLIAFYTVVSVAKDRQAYLERDPWRAALKAIPKYVFWGLIVLGAYEIYLVHPLYRVMTVYTHVFIRHFLWAYIFCGLPYFFLEEMFRACTDNFLADPYIRFVALLKSLWKLNFARFKRRLFNKRNRRTLLSWLLRFHYIPVMVEQVHYGINTVDWHNLFYDGSLAQIVFLAAALAWLIDSNNASVGYFWQSTFTKTRFRDADPHPSHWIITLACYMPFIDFVDRNFVPFPALAEDSPRLFSGELVGQVLNFTHLGGYFDAVRLSSQLNIAIDVAIVTALVCYMLSGTALAFSYSNLSYKKIQTRGPYGIVRHPATACKMIYFSLIFFRFAGAFTGRWLVCWIIWMSVYVGRALVEERFLKRFPDYRAYMKKTRYRFFPGIA